MAAAPIFGKVLIANRGEIACRIIQTCRRLGIKTVAIHSTADEQAKHVRMADEAVCVGPPRNAESYLRIDRVLDACLKTKADAVHPGYGFLSENAEFSAELAKQGITFVGPDAHSIVSMGSKINSKRLAKEAGVSTIPGFIGEITDEKQLLEEAHKIGYPVMVKAANGGGGKAMRKASNDAECIEYYSMCREEAKSAFGSSAMLLEKFIEQPRHIEIQIIADRCGNTLYLPERECSIQRRNQKVLEEAPSFLIDAATRKSMGEQAVAMARKVQYVTAGTVEMVVDPKRNFYFLEMNTRLQVEHPITEMITGVDLVEQMLRAARGLPLSITQDSIKINGWATEARVYAEDPTKNYFPSIGRLTGYVEPRKKPTVRVDSGIVEGSQISVYYDPLIAKLITWGPTRQESLTTMGEALDEFVVRGLRHNVCLLRDVITQPRYLSGSITTAYLDEEYPEGFKKAQLEPKVHSQLFAAAAIVRAARTRAVSFGSRGPLNARFVVSHPDARDKALKVTVTEKATDLFDIVVGDEVISNASVKWDVEGYLIICNFPGSVETVFQYYGTDEVTIKIQAMGTIFDLFVLTEAEHAVMPFMAVASVASSAKQLLSPMPGLVVHINVAVGDKVAAGSELCTLEAMKMRNKLRADVDGTVKRIVATVGKTVEDGGLLIEFE